MIPTPCLHRVGLVLLGLSVCLPVATLLFSRFRPALRLVESAREPAHCRSTGDAALGAVALLGSAGLPRFHRDAAPASQLRYYGGLVYCVLNTLPISLYAYAPHLMPGGSARFFILVDHRPRLHPQRLSYGWRSSGKNSVVWFR